MEVIEWSLAALPCSRRITAVVTSTERLPYVLLGATTTDLILVSHSDGNVVHVCFDAMIILSSRTKRESNTSSRTVGRQSENNRFTSSYCPSQSIYPLLGRKKRGTPPHNHINAKPIFPPVVVVILHHHYYYHHLIRCSVVAAVLLLMKIIVYKH